VGAGHAGVVTPHVIPRAMIARRQAIGKRGPGGRILREANPGAPCPRLRPMLSVGRWCSAWRIYCRPFPRTGAMGYHLPRLRRSLGPIPSCAPPRERHLPGAKRRQVVSWHTSARIAGPPHERRRLRPLPDRHPLARRPATPGGRQPQQPGKKPVPHSQHAFRGVRAESPPRRRTWRPGHQTAGIARGAGPPLRLPISAPRAKPGVRILR